MEIAESAAAMRHAPPKSDQGLATERTTMNVSMPLQHSLAALGVATAMLTAPHAYAGRPLASDDAGTADVGTCQLEGWHERQGPDRAWVIAPACGVSKGVEIGVDYAALHPSDPVRGAAGLALKWVPESWRHETAAGGLNFGIKLGIAGVREAGRGWHRSETGALLLVTLAPSDAVTLHANLGVARDRSSGTSATLLNVALTWAPRDDMLLFAETQANTKRAAFGGTVNSGGARWWLEKDRVGLDLTASRELGLGATRWTIGFGWYGLNF